MDVAQDGRPELVRLGTGTGVGGGGVTAGPSVSPLKHSARFPLSLTALQSQSCCLSV